MESSGEVLLALRLGRQVNLLDRGPPIGPSAVAEDVVDH